MSENTRPPQFPQFEQGQPVPPHMSQGYQAPPPTPVQTGPAPTEIEAALASVPGAQKQDVFATLGIRRPQTHEFERVRLPSRGLPYPDGSPLKSEFLTILPMTAQEMNILNNRSLAKNGEQLNALLRNCIKEFRGTNVNLDMLLAGDRLYLMTWIRIASYGAEYDVKLTCPACDKTSEESIDLKSVMSNAFGYEDQPISVGENRFRYVSTVLGQDVVVEYRYPTGTDEKAALKKALTNSGNGATEYTDSLKSLILGINGYNVKSHPSLISTFLEQAPVLFVTDVANYINEHAPGPKMLTTHVCTACGHAAEVPFPIELGAFWSKSKRTA